jgi:cell wall-associated NlpC family hydrolase
MLRYEHLLGKEYEIGRQDCYSIIRAFYLDNFGLTLRNYARPDNWWEADLNLYYDNFRREGFEAIDAHVPDLLPADLILMAFGSELPNHCAVYVGEGKIIHHAYRQLSRQDSLRGAHRNAMVAILRRPGLPLPAPVYEQVNLQETLFDRLKNR